MTAVERMRTANEFILRHPIVSIASTALVMFLIAGLYPSEFGEQPGTGSTWITWAVLALIAYAVVMAVVVPRVSKISAHDQLVLLWVMAWTPYIIALIVGRMLGGASWLPWLCFFAAFAAMIFTWRMAVTSGAKAAAETETERP
jgi:O-antigen ligase